MSLSLILSRLRELRLGAMAQALERQLEQREHMTICLLPREWVCWWNNVLRERGVGSIGS